MTIDSEGMIWVAQWGGSKVSRWNPQNGERLEIIRFRQSGLLPVLLGKTLTNYT